MSWSIHLIGTPEGVRKALDAHGEELSGQSQKEFLGAKLALQMLLDQIIGQNIKLVASGHATFAAAGSSTPPTIDDTVKTYGHIQVSLEPFYGKWLE